MQRFLRLIPLVALLGLAVLAACSDDNGGGQDTGAAEDVIRLRAGLNDPQNPTIAVLEYLPESVTVARGTTVEWQMAGPEPHSVTFLGTGQTLPPPGSDPALFAPSETDGVFRPGQFVNSGLAPLGPEPATFRLTFNEAGTYTYYCVIHPLMTGTVTVVDDTGSADTQDAVDRRAAEEEARWLEDGRAARRRLTEAGVTRETAADGSTTWTVEMGTTTEHTDVLAFAPEALDVRVGDRVVFLNNSGAPHTATFPAGGQVPLPGSPEEGQVVPGPSPQRLVNATYYSTGLLPPDAPPGGGPPAAARSFTFVAAEAGRFPYVCILHVPSGMAGAITVQ
ncbi:MAG TPA: plastocyanin/azurin family copper-binding protein [Dehalococcoidia bacterium]